MKTIWQIEFLGDGNAVIRYTDDTETLVFASEVPELVKQSLENRNED